MRKEWFEYTRDLSSEQIYTSLEEYEKVILDKFKDKVLVTSCESRAKESKRELLRFREITGKEFKDIVLEDLEYFITKLKGSTFSDHSKNKIKGYVRQFLISQFKDSWEKDFEGLGILKFNKGALNKKPITDKELFTEQDIKKLLEAEPTLFFKTFLICQAEGGLRTKEVRECLWSAVDLSRDDFVILKIKSTKGGKTREDPIPLKVAGKFLRELKKQQEKFGIESPFVFPSPQNPNKPISKSVNLWFSSLCKKVLGRSANNYLLRHSCGTALQRRVKEGEISKSNAIDFMRHSEKMFDSKYGHMSYEEKSKMLQKKIYNSKELTEEESSKIKVLEKTIELMQRDFKKEIELLIISSDQRYSDFLDELPKYELNFNEKMVKEIKQKNGMK